MQQNVDNPQQVEHNQKWRCYVLICVTSLTNFVSVGEAINANLRYHYSGKNLHVNYMFGIVTFVVSLLILGFDLVERVRDKIDFKSLKDGKVEGWTLLFFVVWWTGGVISITRAGAIGYAALNVYCSAWASLFACLHALNTWGGERDVLTARQLASVSLTLPYWWILLWASVVLFGSAADAIRLARTDYVRYSCGVAMAVGFETSTVSAFFVLSHYEFFPCCRACAAWLTYGGWFELVCSVVSNCILVAGLGQLTGAGKIASTMTGSRSDNPESTDYVPGTNIYVAVWVAFAASVMVTAKWKEASAIKFAQTAGGNVDEEEGGRGEGGTEIGKDGI